MLQEKDMGGTYTRCMGSREEVKYNERKDEETSLEKTKGPNWSRGKKKWRGKYGFKKIYWGMGLCCERKQRGGLV